MAEDGNRWATFHLQTTQSTTLFVDDRQPPIFGGLHRVNYGGNPLEVRATIHLHPPGGRLLN